MSYINQFTERFQQLYKRLKRDRVILSNQEMAKKIGVVEGSIRSYLKRQREPKFEAISRICRAYRVSPAWLILGKGSMFEKEPPNLRKVQRLILTLHRNHSEAFKKHLGSMILFHLRDEDHFQLKISNERDAILKKTDTANKRSEEWEVLFLELEKTLSKAQTELTSGDFEKLLMHIMDSEDSYSDFEKKEIKPWFQKLENDQNLISMSDLFDYVSHLRYSMKQCWVNTKSSK